MIDKVTDSFKEKRPWLETWPVNDLEILGRCPVCGDAKREILHGDMVDKVFRVAPGGWMLCRCAQCTSAYLDPRPSSDSIHAAYANYYTHRVPPAWPRYETLNPLRRLQRRLVNGYTYGRYGTMADPRWSLGAVLLPLFWRQRRRVDGLYRHLPKCPVEGGTLLEIGFGSGRFLDAARSCGWTVTGVDPDGTSVDMVRRRGFDVRQGGVEVFDGLSERFDVIFMSHVIEHVHQPVGVLDRCCRLLKPGGSLYIETPNLESLGHMYYGRNWRDLDAPRHLVLFTPGSLRAVLKRVGFERIEWMDRSNPVQRIAAISFSISQDQPIQKQIRLPLHEKYFVRKAQFLQKILPEKREFISWIAYKAK